MTQFADHPEELLEKVGPDWARSTDAVEGDRARDQVAAATVMTKLRRPGSVRRTRYVWGLAAAAMLFAGAAGAQYVRHFGMLRSHLWAAAPTAEPSIQAPEGKMKHGGSAAAVVTESAPIAAAAPSSTETPSPVAALPTAIPSETSGQLFSEANDLRRGGKGASSIAVYRRLQKLFPGSAEAEISYATLGSLLLEQSRAPEALAQFDHYVERGGPLLEDVLAGKAAALGRVGRARDERRTWESLLSRFPRSVYSGRAKARLSELP